MVDSAKNETAQAIKIAIFAMGGEGGGVLAEWIVDLAEHNGYIAQATSVPGVAQRSGATIYYVELFPEAAAKFAGASPVLALMPAPGDVDIVLSSELMEAGRAVQRRYVTPERTLLIASNHRVYAMAEKTAMADGRVNSAELMQGCRIAAKRFVAFDMQAIAEATRSRSSAVMFGALSGTQALPFTTQSFEATIARSKIAVATSIKAFRIGAEAASKPPEAPVEFNDDAPAPRAVEGFPSQVSDIVSHGFERLKGYQNREYADRYLARLAPFLESEKARAETNFELLGETARYLALSMAFEDIIRVAEMKIHPDRFARVQREVGLADGQILEISEYFHPRLQEILEILPPFAERLMHRAGWLRRLLERMTSAGRIVKTTSVGGFLLLYLLAALKPLRTSSLRFKRQNEELDRWLAEVLRLSERNYSLAVELAKARNAVRGYGETYERGAERFSIMMQVASKLADQPNGHLRLKELREAAQADESGAAFAKALTGVQV